MPITNRITFTVNIDDTALQAPSHVDIAMDVVFPSPDRRTEQPFVFFCFPGGSLTRQYFDLGQAELSFARYLAKQGHIAILIDHPGIGESGRPADGFALSPETVARIDAKAVEVAKQRIIAGFDGLAPLPRFTPIGLGHSMGGMLVGIMQANHSPFAAVAILGCNTFGAENILAAPLQHLANNRSAIDTDLVPILRSSGASPYKDMTAQPEPTTVFTEGDAAGQKAVRENRTELLTICGMFSMIPGSWHREASAITVPVLLAFGDTDICATPHRSPDSFQASNDVTLLMLPETGHNHFAFGTRHSLHARILRWANSLT